MPIHTGDMANALPGPGAVHRRRLLPIAAAAIAVGVISRLAPIGVGVWDKYAGDAAYGAMVSVLVAWFRPRRSLSGTAMIAFTICAAIEGFQATGLPLEWVRSLPPLRFVLGTTFGWYDLVAYAVGIFAASAGLRSRAGACESHSSSRPSTH